MSDTSIFGIFVLGSLRVILDLFSGVGGDNFESFVSSFARFFVDCIWSCEVLDTLAPVKKCQRYRGNVSLKNLVC